MTINETSFFRDLSLFEDLKLRVLPSLIACAFAEPLSENLECRDRVRARTLQCLNDFRRILPAARGLDDRFCRHGHRRRRPHACEAGVYSQFEAQRGLPIQMLMKYFEPCSAGWQVEDCLRKRIKFRKLNLLDNFQHLGPFDVIFCRNVLLYLDAESRAQIMRRLSSSLRSDGFLVLGATETMVGISDRFLRDQNCISSVYLPGMSVPS